MSNESSEQDDGTAISPGSILSKARKDVGLSIEEVANKLNFRSLLVENIEADIFDQNLPETFNRGYLKNYAKLVNIPDKAVIESFEKLNVNGTKNNKMHSFSRGTMKKAENNLLMRTTYVILAIFIGLTVMWWLQGDEANEEQTITSENVLNNQITE